MAVDEQEMEGGFNGGENFIDNVNILKQISQELRKVSQLHQFMQQVETITYSETIMKDYLPNWAKKFLLLHAPSLEALRNNMNNIKTLRLPDPNDRSLPKHLKRLIHDWCLM